MRIIALLFFLTLLFTSALAQDIESDTLRFHSPKKATLLSAVLPGAGQIYNKKYWKLPIIYGGIGLSVYYLEDNLKTLRIYKKGLQAIQDDDPNTVNTTGLDSSTLSRAIDQRKNWRDLSYIAIGAIYALQIVDANVDAHLFYFDVGEDLSLNVLPYANPSTGTKAGLFLALNF